MSESEQLIYQFFMRSVSGAVALVVGTVLCYVLFIGSYLRGIEHYKQRLRVCKRLDRRIKRLLLWIGILRKDPEGADYFSKQSLGFSDYVISEDRLFMSTNLKRQCQRVITTLEELMPHQYPEPPSTIEYPEEKLLRVENGLKSLREMMEDEIEMTRFGMPTELIGYWFRIKRRWYHSGQD